MPTHAIDAPSKESGTSCLVCGRLDRLALTIVGYGVCEECENRIVRSRAEEPDYDFFVGRIRILWEGLSEAAATRD